jgi:hypothetical protein
VPVAPVAAASREGLAASPEGLAAAFPEGSAAGWAAAARITSQAARDSVCVGARRRSSSSSRSRRRSIRPGRQTDAGYVRGYSRVVRLGRHAPSACRAVALVVATAAAACISSGAGPAATQTPAPDASSGPLAPPVPFLYDAYRQWDRWPYLSIGTRTYLRSTYDRSGGNEGADASHFVRTSADRAMALDVAGPGVALFERYNHWHGSPWHYVVDGQDHVVQETATANPDAPPATSSLLPADVFSQPVSWTWSDTQGADLIGVPMPFVRSLSIAYERTHYGTGYFIYQLFPFADADTSTPLASWAPEPPPADVKALLGQAGEDIAPQPPVATRRTGTASLPGSGAVTLFDSSGPAVVRAFTLTVPRPTRRRSEQRPFA